jgi:hypothetical protein
MARYTLKVFCGAKQLERFNHRAVGKLYSILSHPRNNRAGQTGPFGVILEHADKFEIYDSQMERIFQGNLTDALNCVGGLK